MKFSCPTCREPVDERYYGQCAPCREKLHAHIAERNAWRHFVNWLASIMVLPPKKEKPASPPTPPATNVPSKGACRVCGNPSWFEDADGPVHGCCSRVPVGEKCMACAYAKSNR